MRKAAQFVVIKGRDIATTSIVSAHQPQQFVVMDSRIM